MCIACAGSFPPSKGRVLASPHTDTHRHAQAHTHTHTHTHSRTHMQMIPVFTLNARNCGVVVEHKLFVCVKRLYCCGLFFFFFLGFICPYVRCGLTTNHMQSIDEWLHLSKNMIVGMFEKLADTHTRTHAHTRAHTRTRQLPPEATARPRCASTDTRHRPRDRSTHTHVTDVTWQRRLGLASRQTQCANIPSQRTLTLPLQRFQAHQTA